MSNPSKHQAEGGDTLFDPIHCAEPHNQIVQKVLELRPELSSQLVHYIFLVLHAPIYIYRLNWDTNVYPIPSSSIDRHHRQRLNCKLDWILNQAPSS